MAIIVLGALRYAGLAADLGSLPLDATLTGAIFDATDTVQKWVFDGTAWQEFPKGTGEVNTGANVGAGTGLVFRDKIGVTLNFKTLIGGTNITVTDNSDDITISSTGTSPLTTKGDMLGFTTLDERLPVGTNGQLLSANSVQAIGLEWIDAPVTSPLTTKGDIYGFSTVDARLPIGTAAQILSVDAAEPLGIKWIDNAAGGGGITGLNPNSTILDYSTDIADYTTPVSATATSTAGVNPDFSEDYNSATGWIASGTTITINSGIAGKCAAINTNSTGTDQQSKALGLTLSDTEFVSEYEFMFDTAGGCCERFNVVMFSAGTAHIGTATQDSLGMGCDNNTGQLYIKRKDGAGAMVEVDASITLVASTQYWCTFTRLSATSARLDVYDDFARTSLHGTFTDNSVPATIDTLTTLCHSSAQNAFGLLISYNVDNLNIWNNVTVVPTGGADDAIDGLTATFWQSDAGINESISLDMGAVVNCYGLAYYISTAELATMTETQFQIKTLDPAPPVFSDDFETPSNWTQTGTTVSVTGGVGGGTNVDLPSQDRITQAIGSTLSNSLWLCQVDLVCSSIALARTCVGLAINDSGTGLLNSGTTANIGIRNTGGVFNLFIRTFVGGSVDIISDPLNLSFGTQYYLNFTRESTTSYKLEAFLENTRLTSAGSVTLSGANALVQDMNNVGSGSVMAGNPAEEASYAIDNCVIFNNTTTVPNQVPAKVLRTVNKSDLLPDVYNFIRFNGINTQFLKIEGSSGDSRVMVANELAVQIEADPPLTTKHGQFTIDPDNANLPLNGGDPTSSVIDDPSTTSMTLVNGATQSDPVTGAMVMWQETLDANNDVSRSKMKIDGQFREVRWF